jgi:ferritin
MISAKMTKALNEQINKELYSAYLYFSMAAYLQDENLEGMAGFMKSQAAEEIGHAMKFYSYINDQGGRVVLEAVEKPRTDFAGPQQVFELSLEHEKLVTKSIHNLVSLATDEKDYATTTFLNWFVNEQVEEEATMDSIVNKFKLAGGQGPALLMVDSHLGQRAKS